MTRKWTAEHFPRRAQFAWWTYIAATALAAVLFTTAIHNSHLLLGEASLTSALHRLDVTGIAGPVDALTYITGERVAPTLLFLLVVAVWRTWGRYAGITLFVVGSIHDVIPLGDFAARAQPATGFHWTEVVPGVDSFPSGNGMFAILVFGTLAYLAGRHMAPSAGRSALRGALVALILVIGLAGVINLDAWAMDVVGAYLLGVPILLALAWLYPRLPHWLDRTPRLKALLGADRTT